jgi:hypothetical protein
MTTRSFTQGQLRNVQWPNYKTENKDPLMAWKYRCWSQQRNQAQYRGEVWDLDFLVWVDIWGDEFVNKGQSSDRMCMTRRDLKGSWTKDNVKIISRHEHFISNRNKQGKFAGRQNELL